MIFCLTSAHTYDFLLNMLILCWLSEQNPFSFLHSCESKQHQLLDLDTQLAREYKYVSAFWPTVLSHRWL